MVAEGGDRRKRKKAMKKDEQTIKLFSNPKLWGTNVSM